MDKRLHGLLIANGALVLLSGFAAGFPFGTALTATLIANPPVRVRSKRYVHGTWRISKVY